MIILYIVLGLLAMGFVVMMFLLLAGGIISLLDEIISDCTDFSGLADWIEYRKAKKKEENRNE